MTLAECAELLRRKEARKVVTQQHETLRSNTDEVGALAARHNQILDLCKAVLTTTSVKGFGKAARTKVAADICVYCAQHSPQANLPRVMCVIYNYPTIVENYPRELIVALAQSPKHQVELCTFITEHSVPKEKKGTKRKSKATARASGSSSKRSKTAHDNESNKLIARCEELGKMDDVERLQKLLAENPAIVRTHSERLLLCMRRESECQLAVAEAICELPTTEEGDDKALPESVKRDALKVVQFFVNRKRPVTVVRGKSEPAREFDCSADALEMDEKEHRKLATAIARTRRLCPGNSSSSIMPLSARTKLDSTIKDIRKHSPQEEEEGKEEAATSSSSNPPKKAKNLSDIMLAGYQRGDEEEDDELNLADAEDFLRSEATDILPPGTLNKSHAAPPDVKKRQERALATVADHVVKAIAMCQRLSFGSTADVADGTVNVPAEKTKFGIPVCSYLPEIKSRSTHLPVYIHQHETELLQESGRFTYDGVLVNYPPCAKGSECLGVTAGIEGMPPEGVVLTASMSPDELCHMLKTGVAPSRKTYCILCMRSAVSTVVSLARSLQGLSTIGLHNVLVQPWQVVINKGGYSIEHCNISTTGDLGIVGPFPTFERSMLSAQRSEESGRIWINQSRLMHVEPAISIDGIGSSVPQGKSVQDFCRGV